MTLILILLCYVSSPAEPARFQAKCWAWVSLICWGVEWTQKEMERERHLDVIKSRSYFGICIYDTTENYDTDSVFIGFLVRHTVHLLNFSSLGIHDC